MSQTTNTTIIVKKRTRELLRQIGKKEQTYNDVINELIKFKKNKTIQNHRDIIGTCDMGNGNTE
jgi:hypothetical protein